jgi:hypothetical protein
MMNYFFQMLISQKSSYEIYKNLFIYLKKKKYIIFILKYIIINCLLLTPIYSQANEESEEVEFEDKRKKKIETTKRAYLIKNNFVDYYNKYHYPIAFPEIKSLVIGFELRYKNMVENYFNEPIQYESCYIINLPGFARHKSKEEKQFEKSQIELANSECAKKNQKLSMSRLEENREDAIQKDWRRANCKNPDLLALIDFKNYLYKDDKLYRSCIQLKDPIDEVNFMRSIKIQIFDFIREPVLDFPEKFKNLSEDENMYIREINKLSLELLTEYSNFESYYEVLPAIENPQYINHDLIFDLIYPPDRFIKIKNLYHNLKSHKYILLLGELFRGKERGNKLSNFNKNILIEVKIANDKISGNKYISNNNKNQFNQILRCLEGLSEEHLERVSLTYYSGLFKRYALSEFLPSKKELISKDIIEILDIYNNNYYNSKLLELRLLNRKKNCEMIKELPYEEVSFKNILKYTCELNPDTRKTCESFE